MDLANLSVLLIGTAFAAYGGRQIIKAKTIQNNKLEELKKQEMELEDLNLEIKSKENYIGSLTDRKEEMLEVISALKSDKIVLMSEVEEERQKAQEVYAKEIDKIEKELEKHKDTFNYASEQYVECLTKEYQKQELEFDMKMAEINRRIAESDEELEKIKKSIIAGQEAKIREREMQEQIDFFKLQISERDMKDIETLERIKPTLNNQTVLSKLIWTNYFQKETTSLCNRVIGAGKKMGIYKITSLDTSQCYIGQSVDLATRWKDHVKCGLGIDAPATNKLYKAMQQYGVWNFTFEVLEECQREELNEKEKMWISTYASYDYGFNSTKGNK